MTPKELLHSLLQEWLEETNSYNPHEFEESYSFFYIKKNYSKQERKTIFKQMFLELFYKRKSERDTFYQEHKNTKITKAVFDKFNNDGYRKGQVFAYLSKCVQLEETEIIELLSFHNDSFLVEVTDADASKWTDISSNYIYIGHIFDIVSRYKSAKNPLSPEIVQLVKNFRKLEEVRSFDLHQRLINELLLTDDDLPINAAPNETEKKVLETTVLATDKKWAWLQQHTLPFIEDRNEFYELVASLSTINYFDRFETSEKSIATIRKIKPVDFEVFVLDVHEQTNIEAAKRSAWFIGDKVAAYQIFVWLLLELKTPNVYPILTKIAEKCFSKIPKVGPISRKLGDIILKLLYESQTIEGVGTLLKLKSRNKYPVFLEELDKAITKAVRYSKLNAGDVEDYFISDYGLKNGTIEKEFGEYTSRLTINNYDDIAVVWVKAATTLKSEPAAVKSSYASDLKVWKSTVNDIKKELSGQKLRFENFWRKKKSWDYAVWKQYFFDNQLLRFITRKLIWQFQTNGTVKNGYFLNEQLVDSQNNPVQDVDKSTVTLWHPALSNVEEVHAWRNTMLSNEIKQPFKQAFREVYIVTGAEINTSTFSNRYNNHVIRHHKFVALAQQRVWRYSHSDLYSGGENPTIEYPDFNIKCIFDLDSEFDFATTRQIHFRDTKQKVALKMEDIPTLIFSETMRDADLFVGVCSIGAEEQWASQQFREYWTGYSTSELSETAQTRKDVIQSIISKLKIKDKCEVTEKYLKVAGQVRTYKIHFGSGNILMEPNDEYLCIIPDLQAPVKDKLFLPFDGDATLSIIISKALLLAEDHKIKDQVILDQINRK